MQNMIVIATIIVVVWLLVLVGAALAGHPATRPDRSSNGPLTVTRLLDAIRQVESGGNQKAIGDGGRSLGAYQISAGYWTDAWEGFPRAERRYRAAVWDDSACRATIMRYWGRYRPGELARLVAGTATLSDCEVLARLHNGGPRGPITTATRKYWTKVHKAMGKH